MLTRLLSSSREKRTSGESVKPTRRKKNVEYYEKEDSASMGSIYEYLPIVYIFEWIAVFKPLKLLLTTF